MTCKICGDETPENVKKFCEYCYNDLMREFLTETDNSNFARIADALERIAKVSEELKDNDGEIQVWVKGISQ